MTIAHMATFDHGTVEEFLAFWILLAHFRMLVGVLLEKEYDSGTKWQYSAFMCLLWSSISLCWQTFLPVV